MDAWKQYLFESHDEITLRAMANRLSAFRFYRAIGGHANDGDSLDVAFRYPGVQALEEFLAGFGVALVKYTERPPQPEPGVSYPYDEFVRFPSLIRGIEWARQPGHCSIAGQSVFIWCDNGLATISIASSYVVSEKDVTAAEAVEKVLGAASLVRVDPPRDTKHYVCPKYYPEYFR